MSQFDPVKETIDGHEYSVLMLDPKVALLLLRRIMSAVSPSLGSLMGSGGLNSKVDPELFSKIAATLFDRLDEQLLDDIVNKLAAQTIVDGKKLESVIAIHFRGRIGHMLKWLAFALRAQYSDFLSEIRSAINHVGETIPQAGKGSTSLPT